MGNTPSLHSRQKEGRSAVCFSAMPERFKPIADGFPQSALIRTGDR